jgi:hypothetical protein
MRRFDAPTETSDAQRFFSMVLVTESCWRWTGQILSFNRAGFWHRGRTRLAHRFAWELFVGPVPAGKVLCHRCDVPDCVRPAHLFLGSQRDNILDCVAKGRRPTTYDRCTPSIVRAIRYMHSVGVRVKVIAQCWGVTDTNVRRIARRISYSEVPDGPS